MSVGSAIRIVEEDNNRRGDLFGRLMVDVFVALGYDRPRLTINRGSREIDIEAEHRLEHRRAIGECKATAKPSGAPELNKFLGVLDAEKSEGKHPVTGYFISLAGFTQPALDQERKRRKKIVLLNDEQVIDELIKGRVIRPKDYATEIAGRLCVGSPDLALDPRGELLAHERGWVWAIYYTRGKAHTHFALVHSDGTPVALQVAEEIIASDTDCGGVLHKLHCLNPAPPPGSDGDPRVADALLAYKQYLSAECGTIQLDGLPADSEVGSRRLRLRISSSHSTSTSRKRSAGLWEPSLPTLRGSRSCRSRAGVSRRC
jgi:hypothetical protein